MPRKLGHAQFDDRNILPLVDEYITFLKLRLRSDLHQKRVRTGLIRFSNFCARNDIDHPADVTRRTISKYLTYLENEELAPNTRANQESYLRGFFTWLVDHDHIDQTPKARKKTFAADDSLANRAISADEIENLLLTHKKEAFTKNPFYYQRRELVLVLGLVWGLSYPEMSALNVSDMDIRQDIVVLKGKNGSRTLPYFPEVKTAFQRYMTHRVRKKTFGGDDPLLVIADGTRMPPNEIYHMMRMLGERASVRLNSYVLQSTANHAMLEHGMSQDAIRTIFARKRTHSLTDLAKRQDDDGLLEQGRPALGNFSLLFRNSGELLRERDLPLK